MILKVIFLTISVEILIFGAIEAFECYKKAKEVSDNLESINRMEETLAAKHSAFYKFVISVIQKNVDNAIKNGGYSYKNFESNMISIVVSAVNEKIATDGTGWFDLEIKELENASSKASEWHLMEAICAIFNSTEVNSYMNNIYKIILKDAINSYYKNKSEEKEITK